MATDPNYKGAQLSGWWRRLAAHAIDTWIFMGLFVLLGIMSLFAQYNSTRHAQSITPDPTASFSGIPNDTFFSAPAPDYGRGIFDLLFVLLLIAWPVFTIINKFVLQGRTGRTFGKQIMHIRLVDASNGREIGIGKSFARWFLHRIDLALYIGYLFPIWDRKRQTFADKLCETVVVDDWTQRPRPALNPAPAAV